MTSMAGLMCWTRDGKRSFVSCTAVATQELPNIYTLAIVPRILRVGCAVPERRDTSPGQHALCIVNNLQPRLHVLC